ncbi:hypothetical protein [Microbulbifer discodermiae]|uniref:hypothetical protein n=1 Tax=Microbulbifer sp. 2201CG32-9 TaxID=3232309 RepID=UPI00345B7B2B
MSLLEQTSCFISWYWHVFNSFWRIKPGVSVFLICSVLIERCCNILAFVLPLKIVLLASSDSVPSYLQGFVPLESKPGWIISLSVAAFVFFLVGIVLNIVSERLAKTGGNEVVMVINEISVTNSQAIKAKSYYSTVCAIISNGAFAFLGLFAIFILNGNLFFVVTLSFLGIYLLTAWTMRGDGSAGRSWLGGVIIDDVSGYLDLWAYGVFIAGFLTVLIPFLKGASPSIIFSVLSIIILRHLINAAFSAVKSSVKLWRWKESVDLLVFRNVHPTNQNSSIRADLQEFLSADNRELILKENIGVAVPNIDSLALIWEDSPLKTFNSLILSGSNSGDRRFLIHMFAEKRAHLLRNEQYLFRHMERSKLGALSELLTFNKGEFSCQVLDMCMGDRLESGKTWNEINLLIIRQHWACAPPTKLVSDYSGSHPLMYQRFTRCFFAPLEVAINGEQDKKLFTQFLELLPAMCKFLQRHPLYVHNPEINFQTVFRIGYGGCGEYAVETWGKWALEPVGYRLPSGYTSAQLEESVNYVVAARRDVPREFCAENILLISKMATLESLVQVQKFSAGLDLIASILCKRHLFMEEKDVQLA